MFSEDPNQSKKCIYLEKRGGSEESVDLAAYGESMMAEGGNYTCGHTGRVNGPDYRPASEKACHRGRSCFKSRGYF